MDPPWSKGSRTLSEDPRISAIPDIHGHAKGEHRPFAEERPIAYSPRMLFLWFYHACRRGSPRFLMVTDHVNYLTFEDPGAVHTVRRALKLAHAGDLYGAAETAGVDVGHAAVVSDGLRKGMRFSIGAEVDNDPRARPDAQNIVDAMRPDGIVRSVKFLTIDHPEKGADFAWAFDNQEFVTLFDHVGVDRAWELYVARLVDDVEKLPGHIVGHFYRLAQFGHWPDDAALETYEDRILDAAHARGMAIEINTRPLYREESAEMRERYVSVNKRLMRKAKAKGVGIAIGSAAHSPKDQGGGFDAVLQMLDDCDVNEIVFPVGGALRRVVLRAQPEHLEAQQKSQEPAQPGSSISGLSRAELGLPEEPEGKPETAGSKSTREGGPKKRASGPARTTKKPAPDEPPAAKSSSRRSAESAASSAKAKETKAEAPSDAAETAATPPAPEPKRTKGKKTADVKPAGVKPAPKPIGAANVEKPHAKTAPVKTPAAAKPAAKPSAVKPPPVKGPAAKAQAPKAAPLSKTQPAAAKSAKPAAKAVVKPAPKPPAKAKKSVVKGAASRAATPKKTAPAKKSAVKPPAKKAPAKKAAAVKAAVKKSAPKRPAAKPPAKRTASKPAAKKAAATAKPAKKTSKPPAKGSVKKKSSTKRR